MYSNTTYRIIHTMYSDTVCIEYTFFFFEKINTIFRKIMDMIFRKTMFFVFCEKKTAAQNLYNETGLLYIRMVVGVLGSGLLFRRKINTILRKIMDIPGHWCGPSTWSLAVLWPRDVPCPDTVVKESNAAVSFVLPVKLCIKFDTTEPNNNR
jgi:hypothetical protein